MPSIEDFMKFEFRVAEIIEANDHPDADRLYVLKLRVGEIEKQIVAGIKAGYSAQELIGKRIVIVNNLEPAVIRGVESHGMLLAGKDDQGIALITPERYIKSGSPVK